MICETSCSKSGGCYTIATGSQRVKSSSNSRETCRYIERRELSRGGLDYELHRDGHMCDSHGYGHLRSPESSGRTDAHPASDNSVWNPVNDWRLTSACRHAAKSGICRINIVVMFRFCTPERWVRFLHSAPIVREDGKTQRQSEKTVKRKEENAMTFAELLGDAYKEGMTADELAAALADKDFVARSEVESKYVLKSLSDKYSSEAAKNRKDAAAAKAQNQSLEARIKDLERGTAVAAAQAKYIKMGMADDLALATAEAMVDGKTDVLMENLSKHTAALKSKAASDTMKDTPAPPAGGVSAAAVDYGKMAADALANGDIGSYIAAVNAQAKAAQEAAGDGK